VDEKLHHKKEPEQLKEHLLGTLKYISINIHYGKEYTRRDDLISAGYLFLFLNNWLFWDRVCENTVGLLTKTVYTETHIHHPKNNGYRIAKELSNIEKDMAEIESERITYEGKPSNAQRVIPRTPFAKLNASRPAFFTTPTSEKERRIPYDDKPSKIIEYLRYVYNLHFAETPNYDLMAGRILCCPFATLRVATTK
jgi:hypothetical protein